MEKLTVQQAVELLENTKILISQDCIEYQKALQMAITALKDNANLMHEFRQYCKAYSDLASDYSIKVQRIKELEGIKSVGE